jgi:DNA-binding response OmpR family regulator
MDGVDLAVRMRADGHAVKFLFISGFCDLQTLEVRIRGLEARFLGKPFNIPELLHVVRSLIDQRQSETRSAPRRRRASR